MNGKQYSDNYISKMRSQGCDLIHFYKFFAGEVQEIFDKKFNLILSKDEVLLIIESLRRRCADQMLMIIAFLISRDESNFTQLSKKTSYTKFLKQFLDSAQTDSIRNQCDPLYYLDVGQALERALVNNVQLSQQCNELALSILRSNEQLQLALPSIVALMKQKSWLQESIEFNDITCETEQDIRNQIRICFLAVYANNLCNTVNPNQQAYLVFKKEYQSLNQIDDKYKDIVMKHEFFVITNIESDKLSQQINQNSLFIEFTIEEVADKRIYSEEQFNILKEIVMFSAGKVYYDLCLSANLFKSLQNRLDTQIVKLLQGFPVKGKLIRTATHNILEIHSREAGCSEIRNSDFIAKEQKIIDIITWRLKQQRLQLSSGEKQTEKKDCIEEEYVDEDYKCKFMFTDGFYLQSWMLPNEYDTIMISNFPHDELALFEHFGLNPNALVGIYKENMVSFVKCINKQLAVDFYNFIQKNHLVVDKKNRLVVKPVIIENLHTSKQEFIATIEFSLDDLSKQKGGTIDPFLAKLLLTEALDQFVKSEYRLILSNLQPILGQKNNCFLVFQEKGRSEFLKETIENQKVNSLQFGKMEIEVISQAKISLSQRVLTYYNPILQAIKSQQYQIIFPNQKTYQDTVVKAGMFSERTQYVTRDVINLFENPLHSQPGILTMKPNEEPEQGQKKQDIIIQAKTDKQLMEGLYEVQILLRPKQILQLKDLKQYSMFSSEKGHEYLKQLSLLNSMLILFNSEYNRLEFYTLATAANSKKMVKDVLELIKGYINQFQIPLRFRGLDDLSLAKLKVYLDSKKLPLRNVNVLASGMTYETLIKYENFSAENEHIRSAFLQQFLQQDNLEDCQICYDSTELIELSNCKCKTVCKSCLKGHIHDAVMQSLTDFKPKITCPSCVKEPISLVDIKKVNDQFSLLNLYRIRLKSGIEQLKTQGGMKLFIGCQFPDCKGILQLPSDTTKITIDDWKCPLCSNNYCTKHLKAQRFDLPLHDLHEEDITCEAALKDLGIDDLVKFGLIKRCPKCKAKYSHEEGCNHLTCKQCQTHFCAFCDFHEDTQKDIYNHLRTNHDRQVQGQQQNMTKIDQETKLKIEMKMKMKMNMKSGNGQQQQDDEGGEIEESIYKKYDLTQSIKDHNQYEFDADYEQNLLEALNLGDNVLHRNISQNYYA